METIIHRLAPVFAVYHVQLAIDWYERALGFSPASFINEPEGEDAYRGSSNIRSSRESREQKSIYVKFKRMTKRLSSSFELLSVYSHDIQGLHMPIYYRHERGC